ncbi:MAG: alpha/beta hydrolase family protein, partial [Turicibacter sp.]
MKKNHVLIALSCLFILVGAITASLVQTSFGTVEVKDVRVVTDLGKTLSGLLFIPDGVSIDQPAPAVITSHGYLNSREMQTNFNIELSRRGYVVFSMDMYGHGYSDTATSESNGAIDAIKYVQTLDFVDVDNIGIEGHSMGGYSAILGAVQDESLVKSVIVTGSGLNWARHERLTHELPINFGFVYGLYDEFSPLMWGIDKPANANQTDIMKDFFGTDEQVIANQWYGDKQTNTSRILYTPNETHPWNHFSKESAANVVSFFNETLSGGNKLDPFNQIWFYKEIGTLISMLGMFLLIFPLGSLLLKVTKYKPKNKKMVEANQILSPSFWILFVVGTAIPALTYFSLMLLGTKLIKTSALFPQAITNQVVTWAVGNGLIALMMMIVVQYFKHRKVGLNTKDWGYQEKAINVYKSIGIAITVMGLCYLSLSIVHHLFIVDFRFWVVGIKWMSAPQWKAFFTY